MKASLIMFLFISVLWAPQIHTQSSSDTEDLFMIKCGICHTIGMGKIIGPDLAYIHEKRDEDWLLRFIRSSQQMINAGDPVALEVYAEYNEVIMPDPMISDDEIRALIRFIEEKSGGQVGNANLLASVLDDATPEDLEHGKLLYEGRARFENNGPSCISCHNMKSDLYVGQNSFSTKDPSVSFTNLGEIGMKAILDNPPFPAMERAYRSKELTEKEVHDLLYYLKEIEQSQESTSIASMSGNFLLYGIVGSILLVLLSSFIWFNRKEYSVNQAIYNRQIKSHN